MVTALFLILAFLLVFTVPVYIALSFSTAITLSLFTSIPLEVVPQRMFAGIDKFSLMAVPFFILAANVMKSGGLSARILKLANAAVGHFKGGLAMTVVVACMFFGAVSGSSPATVIAIGGLMIPALTRAGYEEKFSVGLISSSAAVAVIIPPSIGMIVYGSVTGVSVGDLFMAGIGPGILYGLAFIGYSYYYAVKNNLKPEKSSSPKELWLAFKDSFWALGIPVVIIGGIYGGFFTPTEAAAVAAVYAIFVSLFIYKDLNIKSLMKEAIESAVGTAQVMVLLAAASVFAWLLTRQQVPQALAETLISISNSKIAILLMMNIILLIVGMFIDPASSTMILAPLFLPLALAFSIDPVHLGIIMVVNGAIGMFTPPFGLNLFVASGVSKLPISRIVSGVIPFIILSLITLMLVTFVPQISLWLPNILR
ncbi:TRAP transporter large permease [Alkaliphilus peptidifermentans]|uniref:C4-dicarboxylate transporter, DctM subunit n=1 Tax=Alkaliphilus peptidifermentans DSM 18978 TaxID=1120976 RepID=A0A1G5AEY8_9FIRM|nr:TRAP transporter large permease subunit [Alkaliphilus peptidifermentans]SCX76430.1 C4-dicarboxylate transporter, DctM subunit [Alkaliphilus peptidifermentans DSM 18978]